MTTGVTPPSFLSTDPNIILSDCIAFYNSTLVTLGVNKTLQPAQPESLILNDFAYRESGVRAAINSAALQNLINFSSAPVLDELAIFLGVTRTPAQSATCTIAFTLTASPGTSVIPAGTRVCSSDGNFVFATINATNIVNTDTVKFVLCECQQPGSSANNYAIATITTILDPLVFVASASNLNSTSGGTDDETDNQLRARCLLAPGTFSTCGSVEAYMFYAFSANPLIISVYVPIIPLIGGVVTIYPLVSNASTINPTQTSGLLVPNSQYIITTYNAGDDFTNVGAASNASGVSFVATGTTPTTWTNGSVITLNGYAAIFAQVYSACSPETVRPLCDTVNVIQPNQINYRITANLTLYNSVNNVPTNTTLITQQVTNNLQNFSSASLAVMGDDIVYNQIIGQCTTVTGVYDCAVVLEQLIGGTWLTISGDIVLTEIDYGYCTNLTVNVVAYTNG
jgi:phage-related baseplate assembly protein